MDKNKRAGQAPIPGNFEEILNEVQLRALRQLEGFGWKLAFVRRPLFQEAVPVVFDVSGKKFGVIEDSGQVNMQVNIVIRQP